MQIGQRLELKQSQQLVMTPQLQQAIKLLQMSSLDIQDFVAAEVEKNPILTLDDGSSSTENAGEVPRREAVDREIGQNDPGRAAEGFDTGAENLSGGGDRMGQGGEPAFGPSSGRLVGDGDGLPGIEERFSPDASLRDHLLGQIAMAGCWHRFWSTNWMTPDICGQTWRPSPTGLGRAMRCWRKLLRFFSPATPLGSVRGICVNVLRFS
jgi:RNA polymerase sigma-54 factor